MYFFFTFNVFLCRLHTKCVATYRYHFSRLASSASSASHFLSDTFLRDRKSDQLESLHGSRPWWVVVPPRFCFSIDAPGAWPRPYNPKIGTFLSDTFLRDHKSDQLESLYGSRPWWVVVPPGFVFRLMPQGLGPALTTPKLVLFCPTHFSETVSRINLKVCMVVDLDG